MSNALNGIRWVGFLEGASFLLLLGVAMPLKYGLDLPIGVQILGPIHGALFMAYVLMAAHSVNMGWLTKSRAFGMGVAALLPFGPFVVDRELKRMALEAQSREQ